MLWLVVHDQPQGRPNVRFAFGSDHDIDAIASAMLNGEA